jgi:meso-butanediol dehydrogenase/(S,S)-butanediol dehydrogenase/diacetyl reductase
MSKVVVITGAGVGLGRALARSFAERGDKVVLLGRTASKVEAVAEELGNDALALGCDVASPESVKTAFTAIKEHHSRVDVLINNASIFEPFKLADASDEQIMATIITNLGGAMLCARSAIPLMESGGHIINITSESVAVPMPHLSVYRSTKAGLEKLSEAMAEELEEEGIRVTTVRAGLCTKTARPGMSRWRPRWPFTKPA